MDYKGYTGTVHQSKDGGYHGRVLGVSKELVYSGMTVDSLESAFRAMVDEYIGSRRRTRNILFSIIAAIIALLAVMVVTCPDQEAHKAAVGNVVKQGMGLSAGGIDDPDGWGSLAMLVGGGIANYALDQMMSVDNYFFVSVGKFTYEGKTKPLSVGVLGHVFTTISKEDVANMLNDL